MDKKERTKLLEAIKRTDLAVERTIMAADRSLMAWTRTSLSMSTFGFTIYKFFQIIAKQENKLILTAQGPRRLGLALIAFGILAILMGFIEHRTATKDLYEISNVSKWRASILTAIFIALFGLFLFVAIVTKTNVFLTFKQG